MTFLSRAERPRSTVPAQPAAVRTQRHSNITQVIGIAIKCILEEDVPGVPHMEGKSLPMAYCGDPGEGGAGDPETGGDIISIDFGGTKPKTPSSSKPSPTES